MRLCGWVSATSKQMNSRAASWHRQYSPMSSPFASVLEEMSHILADAGRFGAEIAAR